MFNVSLVFRGLVVICLGVDFFGFICLGFAQLLVLVGLCLLPSLRCFQPLLWILFQTFFFWDSDWMNVRSFVIVPQALEVLLIGLVYFHSVEIEWFLLFYFQIHRIFPPFLPFCCWACLLNFLFIPLFLFFSIQLSIRFLFMSYFSLQDFLFLCHILHFHYCTLLTLKISFGFSLYPTYINIYVNSIYSIYINNIIYKIYFFLCWDFLFLYWDILFLSMCFCNSRWSTCMMSALKSSLDNSNFSVVLVLISVGCPDSWCDEWFYIKTWTFWVLCYETKIFFESYVWTWLLWHHSDRRRGLVTGRWRWKSRFSV